MWPNAARTGVVTSLVFWGQVQRDRMVKTVEISQSSCLSWMFLGGFALLTLYLTLVQHSTFGPLLSFVGAVVEIVTR